jgi:hypothetical protein
MSNELHQQQLSQTLDRHKIRPRIEALIGQLNSLVATTPHVMQMSVVPAKKWSQYLTSCHKFVEYLSTYVFYSGLFDFVKSWISSRYFLEFNQLDQSQSFPACVWILISIQDGSGSLWSKYREKLSSYVQKDRHVFIRSVTYAYILSRFILLFLPATDLKTIFSDTKITKAEFDALPVQLKPHSDSSDSSELIDQLQIEWITPDDSRLTKLIAFIGSLLPTRK